MKHMTGTQFHLDAQAESDLTHAIKVFGLAKRERVRSDALRRVLRTWGEANDAPDLDAQESIAVDPPIAWAWTSTEGAALRVRKEATGRSLAEIGNAAGVARGTVVNIFAGRGVGVSQRNVALVRDAIASIERDIAQAAE